MFETKLTVVGTVISSPVLTHTRKAGVPVANFRVATTSRSFSRDLGRWVDGSTLYLRVACWRRLAENVAESLRRGDPVMVTGNLSTQSYQAADGSRRWSYEVEASSVGPDLTRGTVTFVRAQRSAGQFEVTESADQPEFLDVEEPAGSGTSAEALGAAALAAAGAAAGDDAAEDDAVETTQRNTTQWGTTRRRMMGPRRPVSPGRRPTGVARRTSHRRPDRTPWAPEGSGISCACGRPARGVRRWMRGDAMVRRTVEGRAARQVAAANAGGLLLGAALDLVFGSPRSSTAIGAAAGRLERELYHPQRRAGACYTALAVGVPVAAAGALALATRRRPVARAAVMTLATWLVLDGRALRQDSLALGLELTAEDLTAARSRLPQLSSADPGQLDGPGLVRTTVTSLAGRTSDAMVAPLCWGAVLGLPGLIGYRIVDTLDTRVGRRTERYRRFGWSAARLDDFANLVPSRLTAALTVATARMVGGSPVAALSTWSRDRHRHPGPNAGQGPAAMSGALGVRLTGRAGDGGTGARPPVPDDIPRAVWLSTAVGAATAVLAAGHALAAPARRALLWRWTTRRLLTRIVGSAGAALRSRSDGG